MRWDGKVWRRWNGRKWTSAVASIDPNRLRVSTPLDGQPAISSERRRRLLDLTVEDQVATNGASVVFAGPTGVVLSYRRPVAHLGHALMTVVTAGLWAVVWIATAASNREDRVRLEADSWGNVWAVRVAGT